MMGIEGYLICVLVWVDLLICSFIGLLVFVEMMIDCGCFYFINGIVIDVCIG